LDSAWGDETDHALAATAGSVFSDVVGPRVSSGPIQFADQWADPEMKRWVWFKPSGAVFRMCELEPDPAGCLSALVIAGQLLRAWQLADVTIPIILPGYSGRIGLVVSVGGVGHPGLRSDAPMTTKLQAIPPDPRRTSFWQGSRFGIAWTAGDADAKFDVLVQLMAAMLRNFGYSPSTPAARELAFFAHFTDAEPPAPQVAKLEKSDKEG
jgi:hypothetical protein